MRPFVVSAAAIVALALAFALTPAQAKGHGHPKAPPPTTVHKASVACIVVAPHRQTPGLVV